MAGRVPHPGRVGDGESHRRRRRGHAEDQGEAPQETGGPLPEGYQGESKEPEGLFPIDSQIIAAYETRTGRAAGNLNRCQHMLAAGKVMHAISTLPAPLQHLGHFLYSPLANRVDQNRAQSFLYFSADLPKMNKPRQEVAYWVALAAMHSWKDMVNGREEWWPGKVIQFLADWPGFVLYAANWERDWAAIWEIFMQEAQPAGRPGPGAGGAGGCGPTRRRLTF